MEPRAAAAAAPAQRRPLTRGSIALHAAQRFVEAGRLEAVGRTSGRWLGTVPMQRALGAGAASPPQRV